MRYKIKVAKIVSAISLFGLLSSTNVSASNSTIMSSEDAKVLMEHTRQLRLDPDLSHLNEAEQETIALLLQAGEQMHQIYLQAIHIDAPKIKLQLDELAAKGDQDARNLQSLFRLFKSPIATNLNNKRQPFVDVESESPGLNFYPWGIRKQEVEEFLSQHPGQKQDILAVRTLVRNNTTSNIERDIGKLQKYPILTTLHPDLLDNLLAVQNQPQRFYAIPYSVAYADSLIKIYNLLWKASTTIATTDRDFSDYLQQRARDLLSNNYEAGDASWITGTFKNINVQIGAYETYDDNLYGVKSSHSFSVLVKDQQKTEALVKAIGNLQAIEDSLPYAHHKQVRSQIPVGVYNVVADFGQSRGTNTASILPNEEHITRKYGRTILLRYNVMTNTELFSGIKTMWDAVVAPEFRDHLSIESRFQRTLWHEVGHYMGPGLDKNGRSIEVALEDNDNLFEEMKADLVSLYSAQYLRKTGYYDDASLRAVYAAGVQRSIRKSKPRRSQAYGTMNLMTFNYFLENGAISFDESTALVSINYDAYPKVVKSLLTKLLDIQFQGNKPASDAFIERYGYWKDNVNEVIGKKMRATNQPRYNLVRYGALGE